MPRAKAIKFHALVNDEKAQLGVTRVHITVSLEEALTFANSNRTAWPDRVIWDDGRESWAKGWRDVNNGRMVRIGAGAYGNGTLVVEGADGNPVYPKKSALS
jgi:hypothetical protein